VANAGIEMVETPVTQSTEEQFDRVFTINTKSSSYQPGQYVVYVGAPACV
jgi:3-oxoacyl-[acyl-carrier protein] reductase